MLKWTPANIYIVQLEGKGKREGEEKDIVKTMLWTAFFRDTDIKDSPIISNKKKTTGKNQAYTFLF